MKLGVGVGCVGVEAEDWGRCRRGNGVESARLSPGVGEAEDCTFFKPVQSSTLLVRAVS